MNPKVNIPPRAPRLFVEASHEISSFVNGLLSGVSSDIKIGRLGENQPKGIVLCTLNQMCGCLATANIIQQILNYDATVAQHD